MPFDLGSALLGALVGFAAAFVAWRLTRANGEKEADVLKRELTSVRAARSDAEQRAAAAEAALAASPPPPAPPEPRDLAAYEDEALADIDARARKLMVDAMERSQVLVASESTTTVVTLPDNEMKGRLIGREGRNIKTFESVTGVDLIIDDTPEAVVLSSFDPLRRETARLTLMNLMLDGRIHPTRIEEVHARIVADMDRTIEDAGHDAATAAGVPGLRREVVRALGRLKYRTSYAQNVLDHSVEVSRIAAHIAQELKLDAALAARAGLLHDIGKALGPEFDGPHAVTGMEFLRGYGEKPSVVNAVGAHHREIDPESPEAQIVIVADALSAARPGARREQVETYLKRIAALEQLASSFPGVERSYAVQAGRELRLLVRPEQVDDDGARRLAREVADRIRAELDFPGQVKVTVIREVRVSEVAT